MNKTQRKQITKWIENIEEIKCAMKDMRDNEEEKLSNLPEGIQESERGEKMQEGIDSLDYALENLQDCLDNLEDIRE